MCVGILVLFRQVYGYSRILGAVVATGILLRAVAGAALFWVSYLDLPFLSHLHDGDGFWQLAPDARSYFDVAATAVDRGLSSISSTSASPAYTRVLAVWMLLVGVSPASAVLMNLLLYVLVCSGIAAVASRQRVPLHWATVPIVAFTFSPALLVFGTQSLKDTMFVFLILVCGLGWLMFWPPGATHTALWRRGPALGAILVILPATYLMAGIRAYFGLFVCVSSAAMFVVAAWQFRRTNLRRHALGWIAILAALWLCFRVGAGPYYEAYAPGRLWRSTVASAQSPVTNAVTALADPAREGFVQSGGATNTASASDGKLEAFGRGVAVMFVPISLLKSLSVVDFEGGRGMLLLTDADTIFLDILLVLGLISLINGAGLKRNLAPACFLVTLAVVTTALMAYVVTNYGTLFRLRLMMAAPVWLLPVVTTRIRADAAPRHTESPDPGGMPAEKLRVGT
jgi:hypothetical protein